MFNQKLNSVEMNKGDEALRIILACCFRVSNLRNEDLDFSKGNNKKYLT